MAKVPVSTIRQDLRELSASADDAAPKNSNDWFTPEFWTMVASAVTNLVAVGVVLGWINNSDAESLTKAVTSLLGAAQVIIVNAAIAWRFIAARTAVKRTMIDARFRYMEAVAVARIRVAGE
jgi:uncharacterized membrane protein